MYVSQPTLFPRSAHVAPLRPVISRTTQADRAWVFRAYNACSHETRCKLSGAALTLVDAVKAKDPASHFGAEDALEVICKIAFYIEPIRRGPC